MSAAAPIIDLRKAIEGADPCGPSLRYDAIYDKIRQARRQDSGGAVMDGAPKVADHKTAVALITDALATRTKDLQLAVWLADSLTHREGFSGLLRGLDLIRDLLEMYWENVHPQPEAPGDYEARMAVLEWLAAEPRVTRETSPVLSVRFVPLTESGLNWLDYVEKGRKEAPKSKAEEFERAFQATPKLFYMLRDSELTGCSETLAALGRVCDERFGKDSPSLSQLAGVLEEVHATVRSLLRQKLETDPDPLEEQAATKNESPTAPAAMAELPAPAAPVSIPPEELGEVHGIEPSNPAEAVARILAATRYLRRIDPANPVPYLLVRALRWGQLRAGGAEPQPALLAAPSTEIRTGLKALAAAGRWAELLELAETNAAGECGRGWLDPHRYAVLGCEKLGYHAAARAIRSELACLLGEYPQLASATLLDDTGAANPETVAWLATVRKKD
jgi:type VI secretion system protein ImpA